MTTIDHLDLYIINYIKNKKKISTWDIAKEYSKIDSETKEGYRKLNEFHNNLKSRLKKMSFWGIVIITKNGESNSICNKNCYNLISDRVDFGKRKFKKKFLNTISLCIDGKWCAYQL